MLMPDLMDEEEILDVIEAFGHAARRAVEAGVDLIEIHCAHQYLIHSFLSPAFNHRSDEWGGPFENRVKFPLACIKKVRENIPEGMPLFIRTSLQDDFLSPGLSVEDCIAFCKLPLPINMRFPLWIWPAASTLSWLLASRKRPV